jgi:uncharacterized membrane protein (DUF4010 family)
MSELLQIFAVALGLGFLVGFQRQRVASPLAGVRTFPLVTILGTVCGLIARDLGGWVVAAGIIALAAMMVMGNVARFRQGDTDPGLTTEAALLLMFGVGVYLTVGNRSIAVVLGATTAVLLHLKPELHSFVKQLGDRDVRAMMQFVVISLVILPILPDRTYDPYHVLNPHRIWWMVVLITGISLAGYVLYKLFGSRLGAAAGGVLGGLISSTATTVSYARRSRGSAEATGLAGVVILLASTVVFARVLVLVAATSPGAFVRFAGPLGAMLVVMAGLSFAAWLRARHASADLPEQSNPTELKAALVFTVIYAVVLFAAAAAKERFGDRGLYAVAVISGLTDMDAITLSTAQMAREQRVEADVAWRLVLVAAMSNLVFKAGAVAVLGKRALFAQIAIWFGAALGAGVLILLFWP